MGPRKIATEGESEPVSSKAMIRASLKGKCHGGIQRIPLPDYLNGRCLLLFLAAESSGSLHSEVDRQPIRSLSLVPWKPPVLREALIRMDSLLPHSSLQFVLYPVCSTPIVLPSGDYLVRVSGVDPIDGLETFHYTSQRVVTLSDGN